MATGEGSVAGFSSLLELAADYPRVKGYKAAFGTAGFRGPAENLKGVAFRSGVVAALRCYAAKGDCGLIVTASHNQVDDNGFKLVDYNGEIFPPIWEGHAEKIVNAESPDDLVSICQAICKEEGIELVQRAEEPFQVFAGHDTRPSSPNLLEIAIKGIKSLKVEIAFEAGLQTTPQVLPGKDRESTGGGLDALSSVETAPQDRLWRVPVAQIFVWRIHEAREGNSGQTWSTYGRLF